MSKSLNYKIMNKINCVDFESQITKTVANRIRYQVWLAFDDLEEISTILDQVAMQARLDQVAMQARNQK